MANKTHPLPEKPEQRRWKPENSPKTREKVLPLNRVSSAVQPLYQRFALSVLLTICCRVAHLSRRRWLRTAVARTAANVNVRAVPDERLRVKPQQQTALRIALLNLIAKQKNRNPIVKVQAH